LEGFVQKDYFQNHTITLSVIQPSLGYFSFGPLGVIPTPITYGVNSSGNPGRRTWIPAGVDPDENATGMTSHGSEFLIYPTGLIKNMLSLMRSGLILG